MDDARLLSPSAADGTVLWADYQRAGRGRGTGRTWRADAAENLLLTVVVSRRTATPSDTAREVSSIPLRAGLAVAVLAASFGVDPGNTEIKWPNDVLLNRCKVCGILCEAVGGRYHVGIGLNVNQLNFADSEPQPTSLAAITDRRFDCRDVLDVLLRNLRDRLRDSGWRSEVERRLYRRNCPVRIRRRVDCDDPPADGVIEGIGDDGSLQVQLAGGSTVSVLQPDLVSYPIRG